MKAHCPRCGLDNDLVDIIDCMVGFVTRYLSPRTVRKRLFALDVFDAARTLPPAVYRHPVDAIGFTMQVDLLRKYYRLGEPE